MLPTFLSAARSPACQDALQSLGNCSLMAEKDPKIIKATLDENACIEEAGNDSLKTVACILAFQDLVKSYCPDVAEAVDKECGSPSFEFEDFALELAEELESTAHATYLRG